MASSIDLLENLKYRLTGYIGMLSDEKLSELGNTLSIAVGID
jgi:hypothetical protein